MQNATIQLDALRWARSLGDGDKGYQKLYRSVLLTADGALVGSDGFHIGVVANAVTWDNPEEAADLALINLPKKMPAGGRGVTTARLEDGAITYGDRRYSIEALPDRYPDWKRVIPVISEETARPAHQLPIDVLKIAEALKDAPGDKLGNEYRLGLYAGFATFRNNRVEYYRPEYRPGHRDY